MLAGGSRTARDAGLVEPAISGDSSCRPSSKRFGWGIHGLLMILRINRSHHHRVLTSQRRQTVVLNIRPIIAGLIRLARILRMPCRSSWVLDTRVAEIVKGRLR